MIKVPVSAGELLDKISILRIKGDRLTDDGKRRNVVFELQQLEAIAEAELGSRSKYGSLFTDLLTVNAKLWDIEEGKRDCERRKAFDDQFIALARAVYLENDRRAQIKRALNELLGSEIVEEKSYAAY
jgi:hypothetical protein